MYAKSDAMSSTEMSRAFVKFFTSFRLLEADVL